MLAYVNYNLLFTPIHFMKTYSRIDASILFLNEMWNLLPYSVTCETILLLFKTSLSISSLVKLTLFSFSFMLITAFHYVFDMQLSYSDPLLPYPSFQSSYLFILILSISSHADLHPSSTCKALSDDHVFSCSSPSTRMLQYY